MFHGTIVASAKCIGTEVAYAELTRSWRLAYADLTRVCLLRKCTAQQAYAELTRDLRPSLLWRKPSAIGPITRSLRGAYAALTPSLRGDSGAYAFRARDSTTGSGP